MKKNIALLASLLALSAPAFARDSVHLMCSGFMSAQRGPDNYGFSIQFDEHRSGAGRVELLSAVWAGDLYQGSRATDGTELGKNGVIALRSKEDPRAVFFQGKYNLVKKGGVSQLALQGSMNLTPEDAATAEAVTTTLRCVDLSN